MANVLAYLVIFAALPLNWIVTVLLWALSLRNPTYRVLRERAIVSVALSAIVTVFAFVFINNDLSQPILNGEATKLVTRLTILTFSIVPALYWLRLYWNGSGGRA